MQSKYESIIGRCWLPRGGFRPVYGVREIKRGEHKGKLEVVTKTATGYRKSKVPKGDYQAAVN